MPYVVYIITNKRNGTLYIGVTGNLPRRIYEHKTKDVDGFSKKYGLAYLVYAESYESSFDAIKREKQLKKWKRSWKLELIEGANPDWLDLSSI